MKKRKLFTGFMMMLAVIMLVNIHAMAAGNAAALNKKTATVVQGKTIQLTVRNTRKKVKWYSSNKRVASVSSAGKVTAKKAGTAKVTASVGGQKLTCSIKVKPAVKSIRCSMSSLVIESGDREKLKVTANPSSAQVEVHWKSSNNKVVTVDQYGNLVAKSAGSAKISAIMADGSGKQAICKIQVVKAKTKGRARTVLTQTEELYTEQYLLKQKKYRSVYKTQQNLLKHTVCISVVAGVRISFRVDADVVAYMPEKEDYWEYVVFLDHKEDLKPFLSSAKMKSGVIGVATDWQLTI